MARQERGVYEPSDEVRVFDGAEEEDDAEGSRLPLLIVLALLVLFAFAGVVWLAYTQGVARGRTETPVLAAASGPEKVAPQNAGGANVQYQGFKIYEQPAPADDEAGAGTPAASPDQAAKAAPPPQAVKAELPPAAKPEPKLAAAPAPVVPKPEAAPKLAAVSSPPVTKPKPAPPVPAPKPVTAKPPVTPPPAMKQAATPSPTPVAPSAVADGAPRTLPGVAAPVPAPKPVAAAKSVVAGAYMLQIGAYKSQADADAAWKAYKGKHSALLASYGSNVQKVDLGDKGTWYRLRIAGFADKDGAQATCDRLKSDGGGCFLGK